jgi:hypothetical protein
MSTTSIYIACKDVQEVHVPSRSYCPPPVGDRGTPASLWQASPVSHPPLCHRRRIPPGKARAVPRRLLSPPSRARRVRRGGPDLAARWRQGGRRRGSARRWLPAAAGCADSFGHGAAMAEWDPRPRFGPFWA